MLHRRREDPPEADVTALVEAGGRVTGVRAETPEGSVTVRADLVVGADGRHSTVRANAGLETLDLGAPMDVLWMRLSRRPTDPEQTLGRIDAGKIFVMLNREDSWQCAYVIEKGGFERVHQAGLASFREEIVRLAPYLRDRVGELGDWSDVKLLTVAVDRLRSWHRPGLLCIGDAAHAMSPNGGLGINLAIQDAVAAANILAPAFLQGGISDDDLNAVQRRREFPTRAMQAVQVFMQNRVIGRVLKSKEKLSPLLPVRLLAQYPVLQRLPARLIGLGFRPEHVRMARI